MTQLNTPYPATAYLAGYLRSRRIDVRQADLSIELACRLFSRAGLERLRESILNDGRARRRLPASVRFFLDAYEDYAAVVDPTIAFLQGRDPTLASRLAARRLVPEGPRFAGLDEESLEWAFGAMGTQDRARHVASLFLDDLADIVREGADPRFELSRYGERLAASQPSFEPLRLALEGEPTLVDRLLDELAAETLQAHDPDVVGLSVPFPGNVYGAFRVARAARRLAPRARIVLGGGYANTELRELSDPRVFGYVDFITLDDGERPLELILEHARGVRPLEGLLRTLALDDCGEVRLYSSPAERDAPFHAMPAPTYAGLRLASYLSVVEILNPMHRLWSDARWNKLTLAHGCYWRKCSFCDTSLDYISRFEAAEADTIVDRMEALVRETGQRGFHFVDEAAPPALLRALSRRLVARGVVASWWANIRFERAFTPELAALMSDAGCIAVSGGLETASDRLLKLMNKGVDVAQVARVSRGFRAAGILVHAYLMYGFPTQTEQETVDSLERVRQLFRADCIQSAYWHRFSVTAHSPIGREPARFGITLREGPGGGFARNDLAFDDPTGCDHVALGSGLRKAVYNYMHGLGLDEDVRAWFDERKVPRARVPRAFIRGALARAGAAPAVP